MKTFCVCLKLMSVVKVVRPVVKSELEVAQDEREIIYMEDLKAMEWVGVV